MPFVAKLFEKDNGDLLIDSFPNKVMYESDETGEIVASDTLPGHDTVPWGKSPSGWVIMAAGKHGKTGKGFALIGSEDEPEYQLWVEGEYVVTFTALQAALLFQSLTHLIRGS